MLRVWSLERRMTLGGAPRSLADGRYELFESIGSGGMATVYRAHDNRLGVDRAIKVLLPSYASKERVRARFEAEARTMAVLDHPNIVRVYDVGATTETAWIVMELVEGASLLDRIGEFGMSSEDCLNISAKVLSAITVAHAHGIVHRDIKPHNVLMSTEGTVRITDFGIARSAGPSEDSFTKTGTVMGTWAFMAPEQRVNAKGVDHTADIYGAGATMFAMVTGQTPMDLFAADLDPQMLSSVPEDVLPIIRRATRYNREERYPDAQAMLDAIEAVREHLGIQTDTVRSAVPKTALPPAHAGAGVASTRSMPVITPPPLAATPASTIAPGSATNMTYIPDSSPPPPMGGALQLEDNSTPLPFRPSAEKGADHISNPTLVEGHTDGTSNEKKTVRLAVVLILVLLAGGAIKRMSSQEPVGVAPTEPAASAVEPPTQAEPLQPGSPQAVEPNPIERVAQTASPPSATAPVAPSGPSSDRVQSPKVEPPAERPEPSPKTESAASIPQEVSEPSTVQPNVEAPAAALPPVIVHEAPATARMGGRMTVQVRISNLQPLETQAYRVTVFYRATNTAAFERIELVRNRATWAGSIPVGASMESGIEYFIKATAPGSTNQRLVNLKSRTNRSPHRVRVSSP